MHPPPRSFQNCSVFTCDVAVVGAGPGGGAAGLRLAEAGLNVLVLEKESLPRPKACGGAMPGAAFRSFDWSVDYLVQARVSHQVFRYNHSHACNSIHMTDPMILVDRAAFDHALIERAHAIAGSNVRLLEGWEVVAADEDETGVTLTSREGAQVRCSYVIAADGATSKIARDCGLYGAAGGAAVDAEITVTQDVLEAERNRVTFDVHCVDAGYGWVFPKGNHLSCGVGIWRKPKRLLAELDDFLAKSFPADSILEQVRRSHPVPVFQGHRPVSTDRVCLVGDAAHMVDPILGEGIKYALSAGRLAADTVAFLCHQGHERPNFSARLAAIGDLEELLDEHKTCTLYGALVRRTIARELNLIRLQDEAFFSDPSIVYEAVLN